MNTCNSCNTEIQTETSRSCFICHKTLCYTLSCARMSTFTDVQGLKCLCTQCLVYWIEYTSRLSLLAETYKMQRELLLSEWKGRST